MPKEKKRFKSYPIGYFHIDIAEVHTEEGKLYLFVAIGRTSKYAYAELHNKATRATAKLFLEHLLTAIPYTIHTIVTDNGIQSTNRKKDVFAFMPPFDRVCHAHGVEHRLTKAKHPWTNGQVERMNRTIKEATVDRYHYGSHEELKKHLHSFLMAYNLANRLKTLKGKSPYDFIKAVWQEEPERFIADSNHFNVGLTSYPQQRNGTKLAPVPVVAIAHDSKPGAKARRFRASNALASAHILLANHLVLKNLYNGFFGLYHPR